MTDVLEAFNYIFSQKDTIIAFVNSLLSVTPNVKLGIRIAVKLEKPLGSEVVEAYFNSTISRFSSQLTDVEYFAACGCLDDTVEFIRYRWFRIGGGNIETTGNQKFPVVKLLAAHI